MGQPKDEARSLGGRLGLARRWGNTEVERELLQELARRKAARAQAEVAALTSAAEALRDKDK